MFFTLASNRRRIEDAAAKARAEGRQEAQRQARQEIAAWYEAAKTDLAAGRFPDPPPILLENSGGKAPN